MLHRSLALSRSSSHHFRSSETFSVTPRLAAAVDFLKGGGEMGERMEAFDWAAHRLGRPHLWPQSLKTAIRFMLTTRHPVFIFWSADLYCFYNDAFARLMGPEKHPAMLGARGRDMWPETWPVVSP